MSTIVKKITDAAQNSRLIYSKGVSDGFDDGRAEGYDDGRQAEYDAFWDALQQNGERTNYAYAFAGGAWAQSGKLEPKYKPIKLSDSRGMFAYFNYRGEELYDMTEICSWIDASEITYPQAMFSNAYAKNITVDLSNATVLTQAFQAGDGGSIESITVKVSEKCKSFYNAFYYQRGLKNLFFSEGSTIVENLDLRHSTILTRESIESIMNALGDGSVMEVGKSLTLSKVAVDKAFESYEDANDGSETMEWGYLVGSKVFWTISLI